VVAFLIGVYPSPDFFFFAVRRKSIFIRHERKQTFGPDGGDEAFMRYTKSVLLSGDAEQLKFMLIKVQEICEVFTATCRRR
jgi:hypothetical protein